MPDQGPLPEKKKIPLPLLIGGGVAVAVVIYVLRRRSQSAATQQPVVPGVATDPNTGLPISPLTGLPYLTGSSVQPTQTIQQWATSAEQALVGLGVAPGLANKAIFDYTNGNPLDPTEASIVNKALGSSAGFPPIQLPFNGGIPGPAQPPAKPAFNYPQFISAIKSPIANYLRPAGALTPGAPHGGVTDVSGNVGNYVLVSKTPYGPIYKLLHSPTDYLNYPAGSKVFTLNPA